MQVIGIDPGKHGCIVALDSDTHEAHWLNMPFREDGILDLGIINTKVKPYWSGMIYLEKVHGRSGWGATQVFGFGVNYGQVLGWLHDKPHTLITPKKWQSIAHVGTFGENPKLRSHQSFIRLNPSTTIRKKDNGLIDAFHIARFGLFFNGVQFRDDWEFIGL
jgi:hypothetical protein